MLGSHIVSIDGHRRAQLAGRPNGPYCYEILYLFTSMNDNLQCWISSNC